MGGNRFFGLTRMVGLLGHNTGNGWSHSYVHIHWQIMDTMAPGDLIALNHSPHQIKTKCITRTQTTNNLKYLQFYILFYLQLI